eukprot:364912-Chlamydomonas_euryale.AAC.3
MHVSGRAVQTWAGMQQSMQQAGHVKHDAGGDDCSVQPCVCNDERYRHGEHATKHATNWTREACCRRR